MYVNKIARTLKKKAKEGDLKVNPKKKENMVVSIEEIRSNHETLAYK